MNVDSETYFAMFTKPGGVLDKIREQIPMDVPVVIQHDNATPHVGKGNREKLREAGLAKNITFVEQPAQSPDMNINDLAFFYSLQCDANELKGDDCDLWKLKESVLQAFDEYEPDRLERMEAILYEIYRQVMEHGGGNGISMPHSGIRNRQKNGEDVVDRSVPRDLYEHMQATIKDLKEKLQQDDVIG